MSHYGRHLLKKKIYNWLVPTDDPMRAEAHLALAQQHHQNYLAGANKYDLEMMAKHAAAALRIDPLATTETEFGPRKAEWFAFHALYDEATYLLETCLDYRGLNKANLRQALVAIDKAMTYRPKDASVWETKLRILFNLRKNLQARQLLNEALERFPGNMKILTVRDTFT